MPTRQGSKAGFKANDKLLRGAEQRGHSHHTIRRTGTGNGQAALDAWEIQPEQARTAVETLQHLAWEASVEMRTLLIELRDGSLQSAGLAGVLEQHVAVVRHQSGLAVDLDVAPDLRLPARHAEVLYRIV